MVNSESFDELDFSNKFLVSLAGPRPFYLPFVSSEPSSKWFSRPLAQSRGIFCRHRPNQSLIFVLSTQIHGKYNHAHALRTSRARHSNASATGPGFPMRKRWHIFFPCLTFDSSKGCLWATPIWISVQPTRRLAQGYRSTTGKEQRVLPNQHLHRWRTKGASQPQPLLLQRQTRIESAG